MDKASPAKVKLSITLDADLVETLRLLAEEDGRMVSAYLNLVLRGHLRALGRL